MSIIQGTLIGGTTSATIYTGDIGHSLRFRGTQYLSRTFSAPTTNTSWAFSLFDKRGTLSTIQSILSAGDSDIRYTVTTDTITVTKDGSVVATSTSVFRDPTAFDHIFIRSNGTNIKIYLNRVEVLSYTGTIPDFNSAVLHTIGRYASAASEYYNGYRARICFVDGGGSLTPDDFVYVNSDINALVTKTQTDVKTLVDAGGNNSFMLDFDNATSTTTLGYDKSSKGNNWTLNSFSLAADSTYDHMLDVPGNSYATLNPLSLVNTSYAATQDANLRSNCGTGTGSAVLSTIPIAGKSWSVARMIAVGNGCTVGIALANGTSALIVSNSIIYQFDGQKRVYGTSSAFGASYTVNDVIAIEVDKAAGTIQFFKQTGGSGSFVSQGTITDSRITSDQHFFVHHNNTSSGSSFVSWNFGQQPEATYVPTAGFLPLCQANLPDPSIKNPKSNFDVITRIGTGGTASVNSLRFSPGLAWIKARAIAQNHALQNSVTGTLNVLSSNLTSAEYADTLGIASFDTNGYTFNGSGYYSTNINTYAYVDWLWKAGGTPVTNNSGSITSQVSANVDAGFSIVSFALQATGSKTVGHGLSLPPDLVIFKSRTGAYNWFVYDVVSGPTKFMILNGTAAATVNSTVWNNTAPTSSVFTVGSGFTSAAYGTNQIAYCFHSVPGYSKIGSYVGNGSADGPYVNCGFNPKFVMIKRSDGGTETWNMYDAARSPDNTVNEVLQANDAAAELTTHAVDFLSNGFKLRVVGPGSSNTSGGTYIYYAVAETTGKYSLGR